MVRRAIPVIARPLLAAGVLTGVLLLFGRSFSSAQSGPSPGRSSTLATSPSPASPEQAAGARLFAGDCAWCHGAGGEGTNRGPSLIGVGAASADFWLSTGRMPIPQPEDDPPRGPVKYSRAEIGQLVAFVAALGAGPDIPAANPEAGDLAEGQELYELNCAACHSSTGAGGALTTGKLAPALAPDSSVEIAEAIRLGPGTMPVFGVDTLSDDQVNSILRYTEYLKKPDDRGGLGLSHVGPIAEGFVIWAVAMIFLLVVIRWIGKTAEE
jgi:quinol---cytochrome-c reductase cytochrome c subunit